MKKSKPPKTRTERLRRKKIKMAWTPERKAAQRARMAKLVKNPDYIRKVSEGVKKALTNPEFLASQTAHLRKAQADPQALKRQSDGIKKSWTSERKATQRARMLKLRADPEISARRKAGVDKTWRDPDYRDRMDAAKKKSEARPKLRARRKAQCRKMNTDPGVKARRTSTLNNMWDEFRAARAALRTAKPRMGRGRPRKDELYRIPAGLHPKMSYRQIASTYDPDFAKDPDAAAERMRIGIKRFRLSQKTGAALP